MKVCKRSDSQDPLFFTNIRLGRRADQHITADVAGYSRLIGLDEEGTIIRLRTYRRIHIDPTIARHGGRIVKMWADR